MADEKQKPKQQSGQQPQQQKQQHGSRKIRNNPASPGRVDRIWKTRRDSRVHPTAVRRIANQGQSEFDRSGNRKAS